MFPFVRKDSSDSKPPPKKPCGDVKKEKPRCAAAVKYSQQHIAISFMLFKSDIIPSMYFRIFTLD